MDNFLFVCHQEKEMLCERIFASRLSLCVDKQEVMLKAVFVGIFYFFTATFLGVLLTYLKNTGNATKKATHIRYSIPLIWV